jgi:xanthine dehydrogenase accessory factor
LHHELFARHTNRAHLRPSLFGNSFRFAAARHKVIEMSRQIEEPRRSASKELQAIAQDLVANDTPSVLATLVSVQGSSYRRPGARLLVRSDDTRIGSISGGCLEEDLMARAHKVANTGVADAVVYDTTSENDLVWGVGLGCHGIVRVLLESVPPHPRWAQTLVENFEARRTTRLIVYHGDRSIEPLGTNVAPATNACGADAFIEEIAPPRHLAVFGAGNDARPVVRLAKELGWRVTVADPRPAFATKERFPEANEVILGTAAELPAKVRLDADSLAVVMTHHYIHDVPLLRNLIAQPVRYLGLLGPKKRAEKIMADIAAAGFTPTAEQSARLHAPVGLDIGADAPEQVALAMIAEMQAVLSDRSARPLRERTTPIHDASAIART